MTDPNGTTITYDVFTFTWNGGLTHPATVEPETWDNTLLEGSFTVNTGGYCVVEQNRQYYFANYYAGGDGSLQDTGGFTTDNGFTGQLGNIGWVEYRPMQ
ncbi:hypothetical protein [Kytococcus sp. Marseille-QA3725]